MNRERYIAEARRMFEYQGTLTIPVEPEVHDAGPGTWSGRGAWVQAWVFVPAPEEDKEDSDG